MRAPSKFENDVYEAVKTVPKGKVASYSQIALMSGHRGAARAVGNALHINPYQGEVPCHRVVHSTGGLAPDFAFGGIEGQARLLNEEGVETDGNTVDMDKYQWRGES